MRPPYPYLGMGGVEGPALERRPLCHHLPSSFVCFPLRTLTSPWLTRVSIGLAMFAPEIYQGMTDRASYTERLRNIIVGRLAFVSHSTTGIRCSATCQGKPFNGSGGGVLVSVFVFVVNHQVRRANTLEIWGYPRLIACVSANRNWAAQ